MRCVGKVKWFDAAKGYGFIVPDGGGRDHFVHTSDLQAGVDYMVDGAPVSFVAAEGKPGKGPKAIDVRGAA